MDLLIRAEGDHAECVGVSQGVARRFQPTLRQWLWSEAPRCDGRHACGVSQDIVLRHNGPGRRRKFIVPADVFGTSREDAVTQKRGVVELDAARRAYPEHYGMSAVAPKPITAA